MTFEFELAPKYIDIYLCQDDLDDNTCLLQVSQYSVLELPEKVVPYGDDVEITLGNIIDPAMSTVFSQGKKKLTVKFFPEFARKVFIVMYGFNFIARIREEQLSSSANPSIKELGYIVIK